MSLTNDPRDPRLKETRADGQQVAYLVLSDEERAKGFVRPVRETYRHVGTRPTFHTRELTDEERERYKDYGYVLYEGYPEGHKGVGIGKFWTQAQLDSGCGATTTMHRELAETYARNPSYYGATFCASCGKHLPVGPNGEFVWIEKDGSDGPRVGS